jgi:hypothetical protein
MKTNEALGRIARLYASLSDETHKQIEPNLLEDGDVTVIRDIYVDMLNELEGTPHHERTFELHEHVEKDDFEALSQDDRIAVRNGYVREPCVMSWQTKPVRLSYRK